MITIGDMVMYYGAFQRGQGALQGVWTGLTRLYEDNLFLANFNEFLDLKPKLVEPPAPAASRPVKEGIFLDRINFRYPTGEKNHLRISTSRFFPDRWWRWWVRMAREKRRLSSSSPVSMTR